MYYALIILSVIMFGAEFALNDKYRSLRGNTIKVSLQFSLISGLAGLVVLMLINGFRLEFTWFTFLMAVLTALAGIGFIYFGFKSLAIINLSLYSVFCMLGGMVLPFLLGILVYGESITIAKIVCIILICIALFLTVERGEKSKGIWYYIGIFVMNGMTGVLAKLFTEAPYPKTSEAGFSILTIICCVVISAIWLLFVSKKSKETEKMKLSTETIGAVSGIINRLANFILLIALVHVDASVQYPMITGGVMIVSTLICYFGPKKPSKRELLSVAFAFLGMLALFAIPV